MTASNARLHAARISPRLCHSWQLTPATLLVSQVRDLVNELSQELNAIHAAALLTHTGQLLKRSASLQPRDARLLTLLTPRLAELVAGHVASFSPRSLANVLHALAVLQYPDRPLIASLLEQVEAQLPDFDAQVRRRRVAASCRMAWRRHQAAPPAADAVQ